MPIAHYTYQDLVGTLQSLGIGKGDTVTLKAGIWTLGIMDAPPPDILDLYIKALDEVIDLDKGTIVAATGSTNLCGTDTVYRPDSTPGMTGVVAEKVRTTPGAIRSFHAFESYTALGARADEIVSGLSRHSYGPDTPEDRLIALDAKAVSIGLPAQQTCSTVHHAEVMAGVPYRYIREYCHPVAHGDENPVLTRFYRNPWYTNSDVQKSYPRFFETVGSRGFGPARARIGKGFMDAYSLREFYAAAIGVFRDDPYAMLAHEPTLKPWRE